MLAFVGAHSGVPVGKTHFLVLADSDLHLCISQCGRNFATHRVRGMLSQFGEIVNLPGNYLGAYELDETDSLGRFPCSLFGAFEVQTYQ